MTRATLPKAPPRVWSLQYATRGTAWVGSSRALVPEFRRAESLPAVAHIRSRHSTRAVGSSATHTPLRRPSRSQSHPSQAVQWARAKEVVRGAASRVAEPRSSVVQVARATLGLAPDRDHRGCRRLGSRPRHRSPSPYQRDPIRVGPGPEPRQRREHLRGRDRLQRTRRVELLARRAMGPRAVRSRESRLSDSQPADHAASGANSLNGLAAIPPFTGSRARVAVLRNVDS
jgi:hypothetical protein